MNVLMILLILALCALVCWLMTLLLRLVLRPVNAVTRWLSAPFLWVYGGVSRGVRRVFPEPRFISRPQWLGGLRPFILFLLSAAFVSSYIFPRLGDFAAGTALIEMLFSNTTLGSFLMLLTEGPEFTMGAAIAIAFGSLLSGIFLRDASNAHWAVKVVYCVTFVCMSAIAAELLTPVLEDLGQWLETFTLDTLEAFTQPAEGFWPVLVHIGKGILSILCCYTLLVLLLMTLGEYLSAIYFGLFFMGAFALITILLSSVAPNWDGLSVFTTLLFVAAMVVMELFREDPPGWFPAQ